MEYFRNSVCDSFFTYPTTTDDIENDISKLKPGKATGPYSRSVDILELRKFVLSTPLNVTVFGKNGLNEICLEPFFSATHFETLKCIQKHSQCILKRLQRSPTEIGNVPYH